ncbi:MAG: 30S ribosomal protein S8 [Deltaproteobacteria bacterium]|nr:30S ribosomal protein S8 [Deltaproteobacteria bacterium]
MVTDPIANLLTNIRNASMSGLARTVVPASNAKERILQLLLDEGYIAGFKRVSDLGGKDSIQIELRYLGGGKPVIKEIKRISRPGRRVYVKRGEIPEVKGGLGVVIVSTSSGILSDREARKVGLGGEVICTVF